MAAASGQSLTKDALRHVEAARRRWQRGDGAMAHIRLAFAKLPEVSQLEAYRAFLADHVLAAGMAPNMLRRHLGLEEPEQITKFDINQPRVPAGSGRESGRWASGAAPTASPTAETLITNIASTTTNFDYACRILKIDPIDAGDALHAAKDAAHLGGADNCTFDLKTGDIFFDGEHIGNLRD